MDNNIAITGDKHGIFKNISTGKLRKLSCDFPPTVVAIMGDAAFLFENNPEDPTEVYWLKWLEARPWITCSSLGNHEHYERIYQLPLVDFFGGKAYQVSKKIYYLENGGVYKIDGKTILNFGGAQSTDTLTRKIGIDWWPQEIPIYKDYYRALENLKKVDFKVDYVWSHTAPHSALNLLKEKTMNVITGRSKVVPEERLKDPTVDLLDSLEEQIEFKLWTFGHFHEDIKISPKFRVLYQQVYSLKSL